MIGNIVLATTAFTGKLTSVKVFGYVAHALFLYVHNVTLCKKIYNAPIFVISAHAYLVNNYINHSVNLLTASTILYIGQDETENKK